MEVYCRVVVGGRTVPRLIVKATAQGNAGICLSQGMPLWRLNRARRIGYAHRAAELFKEPHGKPSKSTMEKMGIGIGAWSFYRCWPAWCARHQAPELPQVIWVQESCCL